MRWKGTFKTELRYGIHVKMAEGTWLGSLGTDFCIVDPISESGSFLRFRLAFMVASDTKEGEVYIELPKSAHYDACSARVAGSFVGSIKDIAGLTDLGRLNEAIIGYTADCYRTGMEEETTEHQNRGVKWGLVSGLAAAAFVVGGIAVTVGTGGLAAPAVIAGGAAAIGAGGLAGSEIGHAVGHGNVKHRPHAITIKVNRPDRTRPYLVLGVEASLTGRRRDMQDTSDRQKFTIRKGFDIFIWHNPGNKGNCLGNPIQSKCTRTEKNNTVTYTLLFGAPPSIHKDWYISFQIFDDFFKWNECTMTSLQYSLPMSENEVDETSAASWHRVDGTVFGNGDSMCVHDQGHSIWIGERATVVVTTNYFIAFRVVVRPSKIVGSRRKLVSHCADCFDGVGGESVEICVRRHGDRDGKGAKYYKVDGANHEFFAEGNRGVVVWCRNASKPEHKSSLRFIQKNDTNEGGVGKFAFVALMEKVPWRCGTSPVIYWDFNGKDDPAGANA